MYNIVYHPLGSIDNVCLCVNVCSSRQSQKFYFPILFVFIFMAIANDMVSHARASGAAFAQWPMDNFDNIYGV